MTRAEQKKKEQHQIEMMLNDLEIPHNDNALAQPIKDPPDFWLCQQGRRIAVELTEYNSSEEQRRSEEEWINLSS